MFSKVLVVAALLATALPTTLAHPKCSSKEFFYGKLTVCLPKGGPKNPDKAPKPFKCPSYGWVWNKKFKQCVPTLQTPYAPQCPKNFEWCPPEALCKPIPVKTQPTPPKTSKVAGQKVHHKRLQIALPPKCAVGLDACPIPTADGLSEDFECIDTTTELESCGGCVSLGQGQDCTAIPHALNVACNVGKCQVSSCKAGFKLVDGACVSA